MSCNAEMPEKNPLISTPVVPSLRTSRRLGQPISWWLVRDKAGPAPRLHYENAFRGFFRGGSAEILRLSLIIPARRMIKLRSDVMKTKKACLQG
jgi:hypothetical protein